MNPTLRFWTFIGTVILLVLFLGSIPAQGAEHGEVGCYTASMRENYNYDVIHKTHDEIRHASVGHYLWIQFAAVLYGDGDHDPVNTVSIDLTGYEVGEEITICTTYIAEGIITTGAGSAWRNTPTPAPDQEPTQKAPRVVTTTLTPHPELMEAWLTANGWIIQ